MNEFFNASLISFGVFLVSAIIGIILAIIADCLSSDSNVDAIPVIVGIVSLLASGVLFFIGLFQYNINTCPKCETTTFNKYCEECGTYVERTRTCPGCGYRLSYDKENFCPGCGTEIEKE